MNDPFAGLEKVTVLRVSASDRLTFVCGEAMPQLVHALLDQLKEALPGIDITIVTGVTGVLITDGNGN